MTSEGYLCSVVVNMLEYDIVSTQVVLLGTLSEK